MRDLMQQDLEVVSRPFGEFIPGGNAAQPGQIDDQIEIVKQLVIKGKTITVPTRLRGRAGASTDPVPENKEKKKAKRDARKKARQKGKSGSKEN